MGVNLDTKERTEQRKAAAAAIHDYEDNLERLKKIRLYTLSELEVILQVTHRTLLTYIKNGKLKGVKIGGKWRITEENLRKFLNGEN